MAPKKDTKKRNSSVDANGAKKKTRRTNESHVVIAGKAVDMSMIEQFKTASEREQLMLVCFVQTMGKRAEVELEQAKNEGESMRQETERIRLQAVKAEIELEKLKAQNNKQQEAAEKGIVEHRPMNNNRGHGGWQPVPQGFGGYGSGGGGGGYRPGDYGDYGGGQMRGDNGGSYSMGGGMGNYGGGQMMGAAYGPVESDPHHGGAMMMRGGGIDNGGTHGMRGVSNDAYGPSSGASWEVGNGGQSSGMAMAQW
ncbi:hypothetical protein CPC08DRAFT_770395 [Agrocybe pediades]|nr:hypothetical protein CPC08DRAFT_770395 [Agrocybe pediades]